MIPTRNPELADDIFRVTVTGDIHRRKYVPGTGCYEFTGEVLAYETVYGPFSDAVVAREQGIRASRGITNPVVTVERGRVAWSVESVTP